MNSSMKSEIWFVTGSQRLYGDEVLNNVAAHSKEITGYISDAITANVDLKFHSVITSAEAVSSLCKQATSEQSCAGIIFWMHTFSPARMWINGLKELTKPFVHLHTQYNSRIPWSEIDMDFMNENQSAHGDREFGFLVTRLRKNRKVIVGHWKDKKVTDRLDVWVRAALGWREFQSLKVTRIGDNMRDVAVTEGDKVEAQSRFGFSVNGYGVGDLVQFVNDVDDSQIKSLLGVYESEYTLDKNTLSSKSLFEAARIELGLRAFLKDKNSMAFTDTFEDLHGLHQLPGLAVQRLMADGFGFGAEGDWKTSALLRAVKVMDSALEGGTSFMEDYTYDLNDDGSLVLGAHMLEICPTIASTKPRCEVHPLGIGGKNDPARLVFGVSSGQAINAALIDMGNRFRLLVNEVEVVEPPQDLPKLPVARVLWKPAPSMETAAETWILGGGAHHTVFSKAIKTEYMEDFADMAGIEMMVIDKQTRAREFKNQLKWNEVYYHLFENRL